MPFPFDSARHQEALGTPSGYRRWSRYTVQRDGVSRQVEPVGARFTQDSRRDGRWDGQLSFAGDDLLPRRPGDLLTPFGSRVVVELGLELLDGSVASVPYGTFEITSSRVRAEPGARTVDVSLGDLSGPINRYRFENPNHVVAGTDLGDLVNRVVLSRTGFNPGVSPVGLGLTAPRTLGLDTGTPPWNELLDVLAGFNLTAWYDRTSTIQIGVLDSDSGEAYPLDAMTSFSADFDTMPPNVVIVRGEPENGANPVQAVVMDTEPSSPTYAGTGPGTSPYGRVTHFYSSPLITTFPQAQSTATSILETQLGAGATYTLTRPYDPTISAGDIVTYGGVTYAVDAISLEPLGETTLQVRELA